MEYYYLNGEFVPSSEAKIPVRTHGFLYGTTVFEGIRAYYNDDEGQMYIFRAKEHFERMANSAKIMFIKPPKSTQEYCDITKELLQKNDYKQDTYIRPTLFKSAQKVGPGLLDNPDSDLIFTTPLGDYVDTSSGLSVCVSSWDRLEDNTIPPRAKISGAYANTALIITEARLAGFHDAIVLSNNGHVAEGSAMNFFMISGNTLHTPPTTGNILVGVTRNTVMEIAREELGMEICEREIDRTELYLCDEAFYCGTGAQVAPIVKIDNRPIGNGVVGEKVKALQELYFNVVKGKVPKYRKWCTPVYD
jgi:branched-chain amino acid aminotransferase